MKKKKTRIGKRIFNDRDVGRVFERNGRFIQILGVKQDVKVVGEYTIRSRYWFREWRMGWGGGPGSWDNRTWSFNEGKYRFRRVSKLEFLLKFNEVV